MSISINNKHEEFGNLYEKIKEKHTDKIMEIGKRMRNYHRRKIFYIIVAIIILIVLPYVFENTNNKTINTLGFIALVVLICVSVLDRIMTFSQETNAIPDFYDYYCESIIPDILEFTSKDIVRDGNVEDWLPKEIKHDFNRKSNHNGLMSINTAMAESFLDDYVFRNHYYGEKDGLKVEMFDMIKRRLSYSDYSGVINKFNLGFQEYIYSSTQIDYSINPSIEFDYSNIRKLKKIDEKLYEIANEFKCYGIFYKVVISQNKLMILAEYGKFPFLYSEKVLKRKFLYGRYLTLDFMINFTIRLNEYCSKKS